MDHPLGAAAAVATSEVRARRVGAALLLAPAAASPPPSIPGIVIRRVSPDHPDAARLIERVQAVYAELYGRADADGLDVEAFAAPDGGFHVGYLDGRPVASGAWRRSPHSALGAPATAEIKRMYVVEEAQRRGLASTMLAHLEAEIAAAGIPVVTLSTGDLQLAAIALYESSGYSRIPGFGYYADTPGAFFFAKRLAAD